MEIIHNNPFRIVGVFSNTSARELQKQKAKFNAYAKVGKEISSELDYSNLSPLVRNESNLSQALSNIEQNSGKVHYGLFWFSDNTSIDRTALNYLKAGFPAKSIEIWEKVTLNKSVDERNFASFNNLSTLKLLSTSIEDIRSAVETKVSLLESPYLSNFIHSIADETYSVDSEKILQDFIDTILQQTQKSLTSQNSKYIFSGCNGTTRKYLSAKFTEEPVYNIEQNISKAKKKRKSDQSDAYNYGVNLIDKTGNDLKSLKSLLGKRDLKYKMIADNLAKEILQCGVDYFNYWKESIDPSKEALSLLNYAKSLAEGKQTKDRLETNIEGIEEWAQTAPIKEDLVFITEKLEAFHNQYARIDRAKSLVTSCKPKLQNLKSILGTGNELYTQVSSAVANNALGMVIEVVNTAQEGLQYDSSKLLLLPSIASDAVSAMNLIGSLDMNSQERRRFTENKRTISNMNTQLQTINRQINTRSSSPAPASSDDGGGIGTFIFWAVVIVIMIATCAD